METSKEESLDVMSHLEKLEEPGCLVRRRQASGGGVWCGGTTASLQLPLEENSPHSSFLFHLVPTLVLLLFCHPL